MSDKDFVAESRSTIDIVVKQGKTTVNHGYDQVKDAQAFLKELFSQFKPIGNKTGKIIKCLKKTTVELSHPLPEIMDGSIQLRERRERRRLKKRRTKLDDEPKKKRRSREPADSSDSGDVVTLKSLVDDARKARGVLRAAVKAGKLDHDPSHRWEWPEGSKTLAKVKEILGVV